MDKLKTSVESGDLYGALQMFKTQHARAKKKGEFADALELARGGAALMLEKGQLMEGADLARDYVELSKSSPPKSDQDYDAWVENVLVLDKLFGKLEQNEETGRERKRFMKMAVDFTSAEGPWSHGDPKLHQNLALTCVAESDLMGASKHMLLSQKPEDAAKLIASWAKRGPEGEQDLHLTRFVLQLLVLENLRDANVFYTSFRAQFPKLDTPLVHFCGYLLRVLERNAFPLFQQLRQKYDSALSRGNGMPTSFNAYLDKIAQVFYGVEPPKTGMGGMMDLMKGLLG